MGKRLLTPEQLKSEKGIGYSRAHLWRLEKAGRFPRRIHMNGKGAGRSAYVYDEDEIDQHITDLKAQRDAVKAA